MNQIIVHNLIKDAETMLKLHKVYIALLLRKNNNKSIIYNEN